MKTKLLLFLSLFLSSLITPAWSHALWIDTHPAGETSKKHNIKVYYGEYAEGHIESLPDWYSNTKDFELWLIDPSGEKKKLETNPRDNHFESSFTPDQVGEYSLYISHSAKDLGGKTLYQFNSSAVVKVGEVVNAESKNNISSDLSIVPDNGDGNSFYIYYKGQISPGTSVELAGPTGWSKVFVSDEFGKVKIETPWEGDYLLEATKSVKEPGLHYENPYESIWRCATYKFAIIF